MKRPGEHDTLIKIGTLGGGGMGVLAHLSDQSEKNKKINKKLQETKDSEGEWQKFKADNERRKKEIYGEQDKEIKKEIAKKKLEKIKEKK